MDGQADETGLLDELKNLAALSEDDRIRRIRELGRQNDTLKAKLARAEAKYQQAELELVLAQERELIEQELDLRSSEPIKIPPKKSRGKGSREGAAIICATDWHCEERVDSRTVSGLNEFNPEICERRIKALIEKIRFMLRTARHENNVDTVLVWFGGDMISGWIHPELMQENDESPVDAVWTAQNYMASVLETVLEDRLTNRVIVAASNGNHGRLSKRMQASNASANSIEYMAYRQLAKDYSDHKKVHGFHLPRGYHTYVDVLGHQRVRMHHGDAIVYRGGVGGISISVNKAIAQWNNARRADLDIFGHYHQTHWDMPKRWISCGSLIGYNAWALRIKADWELPSQPFVLLDKERDVAFMRPMYLERKAA